MRVIVFRHGQTEANVSRRYLGHSDSPLTPLGIEQAKAIAAQYHSANIAAIFSSDLPRAVKSASFLATKLNVKVLTDKRLRELSFGQVELLTYTEAMQAHPSEMTRWYNNPYVNPPPGGESLSDLRQRIYSFLSMLIGSPYETVAVFTHGGVCDLLLSEATGNPFVAACTQPGQAVELVLSSGSQGLQLSCAYQSKNVDQHSKPGQ